MSWRKNLKAFTTKSTSVTKYLTARVHKSGSNSAAAEAAAATAAANKTAKKRAEAQRENAILELLADFALDAGEFHTSLIIAKSGGRMLGGREDEGVVRIKWMRLHSNGDIEELPVTSGFFQPSLADIGNSVLCQCMDAANETTCTFAEAGPIVMDPLIRAQIDSVVADGGKTFEVGAPTGLDGRYSLSITAKAVSLTPAGGGKPVFDAQCSSAIQLALDVADVTLLTVELEGGREVPLVADSSQQRDIIAGSIREFVAAAGGPTDSNAGAVVAGVKVTTDGHDADGDGEEDGDADVDADADAAQQDVATAEDGAPAAGGGGGAGGGAGAGARGEAEDDREGEPAEAAAESAPTPAPGAPPPPPPRLNLQKANAELQDRVTQLTSQLQQANTDIKSLRMELSIVARERSEAKTAMTAIERESEAQTSRTLGLHADITALKQQLKQQQEELVKRDGTLASNKGSMEKLKAQIKELRATVSSRDETITGLRGEVAAALKEQQLAHAARDAQTDKVVALESARDGATAQVRTLQERCQQLSAEVASEHTALSAAQEDAARLQSALEEAKAELATAMERAAAATARADTAEARLEAVSRRVEEAEATARAADERVGAAESEVGALKGALEQERRESQDVADKLDKLKGQRNAAVRKASSLSKQMASMLHSAQPTPDTVKLEKERNEYLVASQVAQQEVKLLREQLAAFQTQAAAKATPSTPAPASPPATASDASASASASASAVASGGGSGSGVGSGITTSGGSATPKPSKKKGVQRTRSGGALALFGFGSSSPSPAPSGSTSAGGASPAKSVSLSSSAAARRSRELQRIVNELSDNLSEKDMQLEQQRIMKEALAKRIQELEMQLQASHRAAAGHSN